MGLDLFISQLLRIYQPGDNEFQFVGMFTAQEKLPFFKAFHFSRLPEYSAHASTIKLIPCLVVYKLPSLFPHSSVLPGKG